jgi:hypothetical protein
MHPYIPLRIHSSIKDLKVTDEMLYWWPWIADIKNPNTYLFLSAGWKPDGSFPDLPPPGYDCYITHGDSYMFGLPEHMAKHVDGRIIHLTGSIIPDSFDTEQLQYVSYNNAHRRIARIPRTHPFTKNIRYKASALTNRVTQSKAIVFAALKYYLGQDCITSLHHNLYSEKNIHGWQLTGHDVCDKFLLMFKDTWNQTKLQLPHDDGVEGSYNNTAYIEAALNFTQESYHYSDTTKNDRSFCQPGPFITEKTWKSLLSSTAFISVGQAYVYQWLSSLGLKFDYGPLDLGFDLDIGNLTRLEKIVTLIKSLQNWSAQDLYEMTRASTEYNAEYVQSQKFWDTCEQTNQSVYKLLASV